MTLVGDFARGYNGGAGRCPFTGDAMRELKGHTSAWDIPKTSAFHGPYRRKSTDWTWPILIILITGLLITCVLSSK